MGLEASNSAHRCLATAISKYVFCRDTIVFWCKRARGEESSVDRSEKNLACMGIKKKKKGVDEFFLVVITVHRQPRVKLAWGRLHTVLSVPECFLATFPPFTWSTASVSTSGWACGGAAWWMRWATPT